MIVGQSIGTAATTGLVVLGGNLAVRRSALAHIIFSLVVGVLGMLFLGPLTSLSDWVAGGLDDADGVLTLATFSSVFKLAGIVAFYPWLDAFARFIVRISGTGSESAVNRLEPTLAEAGGAVALEAAWRATLEVARGAVEAVRQRLTGAPVKYEPPVEAVQQIERFLESLPLETTDLSTIGPRLVRLCHALDHLSELHDDLTRVPPVISTWQPPASTAAGAQALSAWLQATQAPEAVPEPSTFKAMEDAARQLREERTTSREALLEAVALQRTPAATARVAIDTLTWADATLDHTWRLTESLRIAADQPA